MYRASAARPPGRVAYGEKRVVAYGLRVPLSFCNKPLSLHHPAFTSPRNTSARRGSTMRACLAVLACSLPAAFAGTNAFGKKFLEENKAREGVITLPSGLQYKVLRDGDGKCHASPLWQSRRLRLGARERALTLAPAPCR